MKHYDIVASIKEFYEIVNTFLQDVVDHVQQFDLLLLIIPNFICSLQL
jgi:hypothetical protein